MDDWKAIPTFLGMAYFQGATCSLKTPRYRDVTHQPQITRRAQSLAKEREAAVEKTAMGELGG